MTYLDENTQRVFKNKYVGPVHVGFVVDKVALGQVSFRILWVHLVSTSNHCNTLTLNLSAKENKQT
jgi:hypothetical protein